MGKGTPTPRLSKQSMNDVRKRGAPGNQAVFLEYEPRLSPNAMALFAIGAAGKNLAGGLNHTLCHRMQTNQALQERGFSAAVVADQRDAFSFPNG